MRGKHINIDINYEHTRITPADAGKTFQIMKFRTSDMDHPRGCGENRKGKLNSAMRRGSPPRMRGKLAMRSLNRLSPRITPADAGKT